MYTLTENLFPFLSKKYEIKRDRERAGKEKLKSWNPLFITHISVNGGSAVWNTNMPTAFTCCFCN